MDTSSSTRLRKVDAVDTIDAAGDVGVDDRLTTPLPPVGPSWYPTVMGTGILATLLGRDVDRVPWLLGPAVALLVIGAALLVGLSVAFATRVARDAGAFTTTLRDMTVLPTWGTVSMGALAIGSAALTLGPHVCGPFASSAAEIDATLWLLGTALGVATAFGFAAVLVKRNVGNPVPAWGLAIVPPMVSATTGAALIPHLSSPTAQLALLVIAVGCFFLALFLGGLVFVISYHHHYAVRSPPIATSVSAWIPLGVVGQSMAAAQVITDRSASLLAPSAVAALHELANAYGYLMLIVSVPVTTFAVRLTVRGFRARIPFAPGWWALTFPIGTLALGSRLLGDSTGSTGITAVGVVATATVAATWVFCAVATLRALGVRGPDPAATRDPVTRWSSEATRDH